MILGISPQDRRTLLAGATAVVLIIGGSRLASRALAWSAGARASAASLVSELANEVASIRTLPLTHDSLVARDVRLMSLDSALIDGGSPPLAGASLAELISDLADSAKVQIGNLQVRTDSAARGTFIPVQVQASVNGELAGVMTFLSRLETGPELMAVRELSLTASLDQTASPAKRESIRADFLVEALARSQRPPSSAKR